MGDTEIVKVVGRRVWDSRGRPTVEAEVTLRGGARGRGIAPAGASTGSGEAVDLRDGGALFGGYDVTRAVSAVNGEIAKTLTGLESTDQETVDKVLIRLDGTGNKSRLGGNAMIATSLAVAQAAAMARGVPLWRYLAGSGTVATMPRPEIQLFGGGAHAGRRVDVQDFMVVATGAKTFAEALDMTAEVYRAAGKLLAKQGKLAGVADEGGYWPAFDTNEEALGLAVAAIEAAGFAPGDGMAISLDIAASDFGKGGRYQLAREGRELDTDGMIEMLLGWLDALPDPLDRGPARRGRRGGPHRFHEGGEGRAGGRRRLPRHQCGPRPPRRRSRRLQHGADQAQPGRDADRDQGRLRRCPCRGLAEHRLRPLGRDRGCVGHASRGRLGRGDAEGRVVHPLRAHGQMERGAQDRRGAWRPPASGANLTLESRLGLDSRSNVKFEGSARIIKLLVRAARSEKKP